MPDKRKKRDVAVRAEKAAITDIEEVKGGVHIEMRAGEGAHTGRQRERLTPPRNLPERNDKFVGRYEELDRIHALLSGKDASVGVTQQAAAHGMGGVGKTSVALEYAWKRLNDYPGGVFVILCDRDYLFPAIAGLADHLSVEEAPTPEQTAQRVKEHLEAGEPSLLVLDNVRGPEQWGDAEWGKYLPGGSCRRLITTRSPRLPGIDMYPIERLPRDQGIKLLAEHRQDAAETGNEQTVGDIVDWFDGLAVGLTVVAAYMSLHEDLTWDAYKQSLDAKELDTVRASRDEIDEEGGLPGKYENRVDAVFDETLALLSAEARRTLEYAALLPEDTVLKIWLTWLLENDDTITLPERPGYEGRPADPVVSRLVELRLLRPLEDDEDTLSLHRVVRRRLREILGEDAALRDGLLDRIAELGEVRGKGSHNAITDKSLRPELSALLKLSDELLTFDRVVEAAKLANWVHTPLKELARYVEDHGSLGRFVDDSRCTFEDRDPEWAATLLSNLASTLGLLGDFAAARARMERAIEIDEKHFDPDHPDLAISYSNLAAILRDLGDLPGAREQMGRAIEIEEKHFDPDHPTLAISYSNLAAILQDLGDLPGAREQMERAIEIDEKHFDPDHPSLAIRYNNLAFIEFAEGNREEACRLWRKAHAILTKHFDEDHPSVRIVAEPLREHCGQTAE
ncbi:MAG: tetratricopeptide repeat protein [Phycisphaerae bacterium]|jgi:tetratricopeptide (TPR) repeat protein